MYAVQGHSRERRRRLDLKADKVTRVRQLVGCINGIKGLPFRDTWARVDFWKEQDSKKKTGRPTSSASPEPAPARAPPSGPEPGSENKGSPGDMAARSREQPEPKAPPVVTVAPPCQAPLPPAPLPFAPPIVEDHAASMRLRVEQCRGAADGGEGGDGGALLRVVLTGPAIDELAASSGLLGTMEVRCENDGKSATLVFGTGTARQSHVVALETAVLPESMAAKFSNKKKRLAITARIAES